MNYFRGYGVNRFQPKKENLDTELLVHPENEKKDLPVLKKQPEYQQRTRFNRLIDSLATEDGWRYCGDMTVSGSITTTASGAGVNVTPSMQAIRRQYQWPITVQMFPVLRFFAIAPEAPAGNTTVGALSLILQTPSGVPIPLGVSLSNTAYVIQPHVLFTNSLTDLDKFTCQLLATISSGTTVGTYDFQIGFSLAYLLPETGGYELEKKREEL